FLKAAMQAQMAQAPAGAPDPSKFAAIGLIFVPIAIAVALLLSAFVLWVLVRAVVLRLKAVAAISSPMDMQPALGLDLIAPGATGFVGAVLKGINPFSIWGLVLTAIGITTTPKLSKGTGYTVATIAFLISLLLGAGTP